MGFRYKNLMIQVMPDDSAAQLAAGMQCVLNTTATLCHFPTNNCPVHSQCGTPSFCKYPTLQCPAHTYECAAHTFNCGSPSYCGVTDTPCIGSWEPTTFLRQTTPVIERSGLQELTELRAQLNELEKQVGVRMEAVKAASAPTTLAQVETLERQLSEALDELRAQKDQLKKKA